MNKPDPNGIWMMAITMLIVIIITLALVFFSGKTNAVEYVATIDEYSVPTKKTSPLPQYEFIVNRSTYMMDIVKDGEVIDTHRIIVGRPGRATPLIDTQFSHIELNPTWDVPKSLADDMVRKFKSKPDPIGYINRNGYYFVGPNGSDIAPEDINWKTISDKGPYEFKIKQKPGNINVLGPVMFVLQDTDGIQMHGTASPNLFNRENRKLSSGCIRVDGAKDIAAMLLDKTPDDLERYREEIGSGKWIRLQNPVRVKVVE